MAIINSLNRMPLYSRAALAKKDSSAARSLKARHVDLGYHLESWMGDHQGRP